MPKENRIIKLQKILPKLLMLYIAAIHSNNIYAAQEYLINPKQSITIKAAKRAINRIAFETDRVIQVIGNDEEYQIDGDNETGQIFITPKISNKENISLTLMTEKGLVQDLTLKLDDKLSAQTILLKGEGNLIKQNNKVGNLINTEILNTNYKDQAIDAIKSIHLGREIPGNSIKELKNLTCLSQLGLKLKNGKKHEGLEINTYSLELKENLAENTQEMTFSKCLPRIVAVALSGNQIYLVQENIEQSKKEGR